jgi:diacylglycerol kinase
MRSERNFRFHLAAAFYVLLTAVITGLNAMEWVVILICIGSVLGAEIFNTAIEKLCDALHPQYHKLIGLVKDMAAGGVLVFAVVSAAVGCVVFFTEDKLARAYEFILHERILTVLIMASVPAAIYLIFRRYGHDQKNSNDHNSGASERR